MAQSDNEEINKNPVITHVQNSVFSNQPTGLVETTFAETIGLSMHNAISNQQNSQMTTAASITNACARLLQAPAPPLKPEKVEKKEPEPEPKVEQETELKENSQPPKKKRFNILNFLKNKNNKNDQQKEDE